MSDEIYGFVENIVYASDAFTVARLKEPRKADLTCIVGQLPSLQPGETVRCKGSWKHHAQHGMQFEVESFESHQPSDLLGIQKYLESGLIKGIGPVYAERIVKKFGIDTLKVLDEKPRKLLDVEGIGKKRIELIETCWKQQKSVREVMIFLRTQGVSPAFAQKIYRTYGDKSVEKIKDDPFSLARDIHGIGFKIADGIARAMGMPQDSHARIDAAIEHILWELSNDGHVCFPQKELAWEVADAVGLPEAKIAERIEKLETLVRKDDLVWIKPLYLAETGIARELARLVTYPSALRSVNLQKALEWVQKQLNLELAPEQATAVAASVEKKVHIITGGPGTGKSTITKAILAITEKLTQKIVLAAPTGKAAKRLSEITHKKAHTIHSLLEMDFQAGGFKKNRDDPLECDLIIVDESSMIDTSLLYSLLKAIPSSARLILIGDVDQLPSVGPGNVLRDIIASGCIGVTCLTQIFRQAAGSRIITNAHRINHGEFPDLAPLAYSDFHFYEKETPEEVLETIVSLVKNPDDTQVLAPMKRGTIGTENLNVALQKKLNPSSTPLCRMGRTFHVHDKVMQIRNNYKKFVFNGDVGKIVSIDLSEQTLTISFDGRRVEYDFSEMDELMLAYAVSIHKYQGSESPSVIIPVHTAHYMMLHRNLLYTGITRGKKQVILVGTKKAIAMAIQNDEIKKRFTALQARLKEFLASQALPQ